MTDKIVMTPWAWPRLRRIARRARRILSRRQPGRLVPI